MACIAWFARVGHPAASVNEVTARVTRFEAGRVDGRQRRTMLSPHDLPDGFVQQLGHGLNSQQALSRLLKRSEMRRYGQFNSLAPCGVSCRSATEPR